MTEDIRQDGVEANGVVPERLEVASNGASANGQYPTSPSAPRPGGGDFGFNQGGGHAPLPVDLISLSGEERDFLNNMLRTDAGTMEDVRNEVKVHLSESWRKHRKINRRHAIQGIRAGRTAVGGKARTEFLRGIGAQAQAAMSRAGQFATDIQRMIQPQGKQ